MNPYKLLITFTILGSALFWACSEEDEFDPYLEGDIIGYAYCFDEYGNKLDDFSGIKVVTGPDKKYSAITDEHGRFVLKNVINGTYNLSFEKEGFGTMRLFSIKHLGGKPTVISYYFDNQAPFIFENISSQISAIEYQNDTIISELTFSGTYKPDQVFMRMFFSEVENFELSSADAIKNLGAYHFGNNIYQSYESVIAGLPFDPGTTVYCKAALFTQISSISLYSYYYISGLSTYYDSETNTTVYPNLSDESDAFSFIMP